MHLSLSGTPSLALLLQFFICVPDIGAWPDCWVSVEFLHTPIYRKGWIAPSSPGIESLRFTDYKVDALGLGTDFVVSWSRHLDQETTK